MLKIYYHLMKDNINKVGFVYLFMNKLNLCMSFTGDMEKIKC